MTQARKRHNVLGLLRNTFGAMKYDYKITPRFYGYLAGELLNDEFRDLSLRSVGGAGFGYTLLDAKVLSWSVEGGIAYVSENHKVAPDNEFVSARGASKISFTLTDILNFTNQTVVYPNLEHEELLGRNEATLACTMGKGWSVAVTNVFEYDSDVILPVKKKDSTWLLGIQYVFN